MRIKNILFTSCLFVIFFLSAAEAEDSFTAKLKSLKWIAYAPTHFDPERVVYPSTLTIRKDLETLRQAGFNGIVTYGSKFTLSAVPFIAKEVGFEGCIMGVWDIEDRDEIANAIKAKEYVDGYCIGNEGYKSRYDFQRLKIAITYIKSLTAKPTTTAEQMDDYYYDDDLVSVSDWLFVNAHPIFYGIKESTKAVNWLMGKVRTLKKILDSKNCDKIIVIKESGFPTAGDEYCDEVKQEEFLNLMEKSSLTFVYFQAFDQPWRKVPFIEPYWGLFDSQRMPKRYIRKAMARHPTPLHTRE